MGKVSIWPIIAGHQSPIIWTHLAQEQTTSWSFYSQIERRLPQSLSGVSRKFYGPHLRRQGPNKFSDARVFLTHKIIHLRKGLGCMLRFSNVHWLSVLISIWDGLKDSEARISTNQCWIVMSIQCTSELFVAQLENLKMTVTKWKDTHDNCKIWDYFLQAVSLWLLSSSYLAEQRTLC